MINLRQNSLAKYFSAELIILLNEFSSIFFQRLTIFINNEVI